jgi:tRNA(fMet)-specific endonuclease VapC
MARLIDTSVFIEIEQRGQPISDLFRTMTGEPVGLSSVTAAELLFGVERADAGKRRLARAAFIETVFSALFIVPFDLPAAREYARMSAYLRRVGQDISVHDHMIAATALAHGFSVVTHNMRHFERVPGLDVRLATL